MRGTPLLVGACALALSASAGQAQIRPRRDVPRPRAGARQAPTDREQLQQRVQRQVWQLTQRRVGLSDAQMSQLAPVHERFQTQRTSILREERQTRVALRDAMRDTASADQSRISGYLDQLVQLQRRRADLVEQEQKELARFMTPVQRARYTALQEQIRRRVEQLRRQNGIGPDTSANSIGRR
jgi:protein CpxP